MNADVLAWYRNSLVARRDAAQRAVSHQRRRLAKSTELYREPRERLLQLQLDELDLWNAALDECDIEIRLLGCICPKACDCEDYPAGLVSNHCPKHNDTPMPVPECKAHG